MPDDERAVLELSLREVAQRLLGLVACADDKVCSRRRFVDKMEGERRGNARCSPVVVHVLHCGGGVSESIVITFCCFIAASAFQRSLPSPLELGNLVVVIQVDPGKQPFVEPAFALIEKNATVKLL